MKQRQSAQASILDRLIDREPNVTHEPVQEGFSVGQIKDAVARDLENLLNTRRNIIAPPASYREVNTSLFVYGLPDFTSSNPAHISVRSQLRLEIEKTISRFEPRLKNITVHIDSPVGGNRELKFRITGVLVVDPISEQVVFDTSFDLNRSRYSILK
ncbi:MAG: type VI secretion system baseplate subunit TssE [Desulfobacterales bacterium]|nr:type VI secretion system baseplate subunit TssE [Desulfobulbaceae bacterium]TFG36261.1 MAG: type VI secretion system baseplate subunit TssE [Desulfobacterales bacterium]